MGDTATVARALGSLPAFRRVGKRRLADVAAEFGMLRLAAGDELFHEGDDAADLYLLLAGGLEVVVDVDGEEQTVAALGPGDVAGEGVLVSGGTRTATVRAVRRTTVAFLPAERFAALLAELPSVAAALEQQARERSLRTQLAKILRRVFGEVGDEALIEDLQDLCEWLPLTAGEILFKQGDPADAAYFVVVGRLGLSAEGDGGRDRRMLREAGRGEIIGQAALLEGGVRAATAFAARDSYLARLPQEAFQTVADRHPGAVLELVRALLGAHREPLARRSPEAHMAIAIVPGGDDVDVRLFCTQLAAAVGRTGSVFHLWSARADAMLYRPGVSQSEGDGAEQLALGRFLHELEERHRIVLYETDRRPTAWTRRVLRQADRVLVVAGAEGTIPGEVERLVPEFLPEISRPRIGLVALQRSGCERASGTPELIDRFGADDVYHVRAGSAADLDRLARIVTGRAVGLVLGGGGARGFAHLGVVRALHAAGVPIDLVAGTSIGAVMATVPASEVPVDEIVPRAVERFSKLLDYTLPIVSVLKGKRITESMSREFGELDISDLWRPYFCMTTNLTKAQAEAHRRGPLVPAVRASVAIPGVIPPVAINGDLHIDGGVLDNLPVEEMRRLHPDAAVIAVDVVPYWGGGAKAEYALWASGWGAAWAKVRRKAGEVLPPIGDTLVRSTVVASTRERNRLIEEGSIDLYLPLDVRGVGPLEFDRVEEIAAKGYEMAAPLIEAALEDDPELAALGKESR